MVQSVSEYKKYWMGQDYSPWFGYCSKPICKSIYHYDDYWPYDWATWRYWPSWRSYYKYYMDESIPSYKLRSYWPSWRFWHFLDDPAVYKHRDCEGHPSSYTHPNITFKYSL